MRPTLLGRNVDMTSLRFETDAFPPSVLWMLMDGPLAVPRSGRSMSMGVDIASFEL